MSSVSTSSTLRFPRPGERLARTLLASGLAPKTVRNTMTFLHSVFALAVKKRWAGFNPVSDAARPRRRRAADANPDLQFLTPPELSAVIAVVPDAVVDRDSLGPVLRLVILAAGTTGIRQSELLGLRWRDVDVAAQRIRIRNAWVRGEHSGEGKSDLSTSRSVPMTDRLALELKKWRLRTVFDDDELVFGHPELGTPGTAGAARRRERSVSLALVPRSDSGATREPHTRPLIVPRSHGWWRSLSAGAPSPSVDARRRPPLSFGQVDLPASL